MKAAFSFQADEKEQTLNTAKVSIHFMPGTYFLAYSQGGLPIAMATGDSRT